MNDLERARRATAWIWAAELLGQEVTTERIAGLVEITSAVFVENLKPALQACLTSQTDGFLPSPGAVIQAASRVAGKRREAVEDALRDDERSAVLVGSGKADESAERDSAAWWKAYTIRHNIDPKFRARAQEARAQRHAWAERATADRIGSRPVTPEFRIQVRRENNTLSESEFPRPDPFEGGWTPPPGADPLRALFTLVELD